VRVVVLGAGAVGSFVGALLSRRHEVTLVARRAHAEAVAAAGLRVTGGTDLRSKPNAVISVAQAPPADLVLLTTKAYDTERALAEASPLLVSRPFVLSMQNGLSNLDLVEEAVGPSRALAAVTTHGVTFVAPGHVEHAGAGYTRLGSRGAPRDEVARLADELSACGLATEPVDSIDAELWAKAIVNAGINPVAAIAGLPNGALLSDPELQGAMEAACREAIAVATAARAPLPEDDLLERARITAERTAANKCSMLQDLERGRRTEIDAINGRIVALGAQHSVPTPVNATLVALVHGIERTTRY